MSIRRAPARACRRTWWRRFAGAGPSVIQVPDAIGELVVRVLTEQAAAFDSVALATVGAALRKKSRALTLAPPIWPFAPAAMFARVNLIDQETTAE